MSVSRHKDLHQDMYRHLEQHTDANGNHMRPLPNNSGADIRLHFPKSQRFDALKRFYDNYPIKYWDARRGFYYTVQASVWLWNNGITPSLINNSYHLQNYR